MVNGGMSVDTPKQYLGLLELESLLELKMRQRFAK